MTTPYVFDDLTKPVSLTIEGHDPYRAPRTLEDVEKAASTKHTYASDHDFLLCWQRAPFHENLVIGARFTDLGDGRDYSVTLGIYNPSTRLSIIVTIENVRDNSVHSRFHKWYCIRRAYCNNYWVSYSNAVVPTMSISEELIPEDFPLVTPIIDSAVTHWGRDLDLVNVRELYLGHDWAHKDNFYSIGPGTLLGSKSAYITIKEICSIHNTDRGELEWIVTGDVLDKGVIRRDQSWIPDHKVKAIPRVDCALDINGPTILQQTAAQLYLTMWYDIDVLRADNLNRV